jgi:hypothetical protein
MRVPAENVRLSDNEIYTKPAAIGMNSWVPRHFVNAANVGLIDKVTDEEEKKKAKSA